LSAADLHGRQEIWYVEQAQNFEEYVRTKPGRETYVADRSWPVRPVGNPNTFVDTQPLPPLPPRPGAVPILDFSEFDRRRLEAGPPRAEVREAPGVAVSSLVASLTAPPEGYDAELESVEIDIVEPTPTAPATPSRTTTVLRLAAAIVTDPAGRCLLVRKHGSQQFMQAGGKVEPGESALETLTRELREELDLALDPDQAEYLGIFRAEAANEPDTLVSAAVFAVVAPDTVQPHGEIEELRWIESLEPGIPLAPLTRDELLPLWDQRRSASDGSLF
ncbi:NUDIX domain-containing protein, partial [Mesorhizobium japonicum]|uniref:NUDIX hydrolase n=1 Tax=Mesorhizobium japonicum TaxID=2066070 RepID=UPI003B5C15E2